MKPRLFVDQKITAFANVYKIFSASETGDKGALIGLAQQKRMAFKEKVSFYSDEQKTQLNFTFRAEKVMDVHGRYIVEDSSGQVIGMFKKEFTQSLINSTWKILDAEGTELFGVRESNMLLAVFRRFAGFIPIVGDIIDLALNFFKYHFVFYELNNEQAVGKYQKVTLFRDQYVLDMSDEAYAKVDHRVLAAMGVALDALQSR